MSRRIITANKPHIQVVVGWDPPMETFFAQVHDEQLDEDDNPIAWIGVTKGQVPNLDDLAIAIEPYANITPDELLQLAADRVVNDGMRGQREGDPLAAETLAKHRGDHMAAVAELMARAPASRQRGVWPLT